MNYSIYVIIILLLYNFIYTISSNRVRFLRNTLIGIHLDSCEYNQIYIPDIYAKGLEIL